MWLTVLEYVTEQGGIAGMWLTVLEYVTEQGGNVVKQLKLS